MTELWLQLDLCLQFVFAVDVNKIEKMVCLKDNCCDNTYNLKAVIQEKLQQELQCLNCHNNRIYVNNVSENDFDRTRIMLLQIVV